MRNYTSFGSNPLSGAAEPVPAGPDAQFWAGDDVIDAKTGESLTLVNHPHGVGYLIAVRGLAHVQSIYTDGTDALGNLVVIKRPDLMIEAREKWDALTPTVRIVLITTAEAGKKFRAIKALRELTGLTQAKRAIEEFSI